MKRILEKLLKYHLEDIDNSIKMGYTVQCGLCALAENYLTYKERIKFKRYLDENTEGDIEGYIWSIRIESTDRTEWLKQHIKLN